MTFLSLAPVASASYQQATSKPVVKEASKAEEIEPAAFTSTRHNSTSSNISDISTGEGAKQIRFLKLGHHDGDWSEEVIEA